jgi:hypothetical protein
MAEVRLPGGNTTGAVLIDGVIHKRVAVDADRARVAAVPGVRRGRGRSAPARLLAALTIPDPLILPGFGEPATPTRMSADGSIWAAP